MEAHLCLYTDFSPEETLEGIIEHERDVSLLVPERARQPLSGLETRDEARTRRADTVFRARHGLALRAGPAPSASAATAYHTNTDADTAMGVGGPTIPTRGEQRGWRERRE